MADKEVKTKKFTVVESLAWHLKSRRMRLLLGNLIMMLLLRVDALGLSPAEAMAYSAYVTAGFCTLIVALTGDKMGFMKVAEALLQAMSKSDEEEK